MRASGVAQPVKITAPAAMPNVSAMDATRRSMVDHTFAPYRVNQCGLLIHPRLLRNVSRMQDRYGHRISYLRVSITDRCNERCTYCMPHELQEWLPREDILTYEETLRLIGIAADLGVSKVRITGGEPLTRRGILDLLRELPKIPGLREIGLSTNGTLLARRIEPGLTMAVALREA